MTLRSVVRGVGSYLPERVVTNDELSLRLDTSDAWIRERTGIRCRHIAADGETTSDLAAAASRAALAHADVDPATIDLVVVATSTPDLTFPATAVAVQRKLGLSRGAAFDLQAVCAGFPYAVTVADALLRTGSARRALVIGAETFSRILDWEDRATCVLFGDGAGAVVLTAERDPVPGDRGILASFMSADGRHQDALCTDGGPSATGKVGVVRMNGREVFRHAVVEMASAAETVLAKAGLTAADLDWLVPHQANLRIIDALGRRLGLPPERVLVTVGEHANTSAASIPLALAAAAGDGRLTPGGLVCLDAIGGGLAWGAVLLRW